MHKVTQKPLGEMEHRVLYLTSKYWSANLPAAYQEWLRAIQDSLDEQVEESEYHQPQVLKIFDLIQRDGLTPTDRARMKDEYALEELKRKEYKEAMAQGFVKGEKHMQLSLAKNLLQQGQLEIATIAQLTGLTVAEIHSL